MWPGMPLAKNMRAFEMMKTRFPFARRVVASRYLHFFVKCGFQNFMHIFPLFF